MTEYARQFYQGGIQTQIAPVNKLQPFFTLFLDAVHQLVQMNPFNFEFNASYLAFLAYNVYTNKFYEFV